jgi:hypothetical protein
MTPMAQLPPDPRPVVSGSYAWPFIESFTLCPSVRGKMGADLGLDVGEAKVWARPRSLLSVGTG